MGRVGRRTVIGWGLGLSIAPSYRPPVSAAPPQLNEKSLLALGIRGDGSDEQSALQAAFDQARLNGWQLHAPAGVYAHSDVLSLHSVSLTGVGPGTVLHGLNPHQSAIQLSGTNPSLKNLSIRTLPSNQRGRTYQANGVTVSEAIGFQCIDVLVSECAGAGILMDNSRGGRIERVVCNHTLADGIHVTNGCSNIRIASCQARFCGDDSVAIVSYHKDRKTCSDVVVVDCESLSSKARGFSVVGGKRVRISNCVARSPAAAGFYIASEAPYDTYGCVDVWISDSKTFEPVQIPRLGHCGLEAIGRDGLASDQDGMVSNQVVDSGFLRCEVNGAGEGMRGGAGLDQGTLRTMVAHCRFSGLSPSSGFAVPNMIELGGTDGQALFNRGSAIEGFLLKLNQGASGTIFDVCNSATPRHRGQSLEASRLYQAAPKVQSVRLKICGDKGAARHPILASLLPGGVVQQTHANCGPASDCSKALSVGKMFQAQGVQ